jgi:hypothetical protein
MKRTFRESVGNLTGASLMLGFGAFAVLRWSQTGAWFFALMALRDLLAAYFFTVRNPAKTSARPFVALISYLSSALPLFYQFNSTESTTIVAACQIIATLGFLLVTLATIELSESIGVSPANRGEICRTGVYRVVSHPMYLGYAIAEASFVVIDLKNWPLFVASLALYWWRARRETIIQTVQTEI